VPPLSHPRVPRVAKFSSTHARVSWKIHCEHENVGKKSDTPKTHTHTMWCSPKKLFSTTRRVRNKRCRRVGVRMNDLRAINTEAKASLCYTRYTPSNSRSSASPTTLLLHGLRATTSQQSGIDKGDAKHYIHTRKPHTPKSPSESRGYRPVASHPNPRVTPQKPNWRRTRTHERSVCFQLVHRIKAQQ